MYLLNNETKTAPTVDDIICCVGGRLEVMFIIVLYTLEIK